MCAVISNTLLSRRGSPAANKKLFNEDKGESNRAKLNRLSATRLTTGKLLNKKLFFEVLMTECANTNYQLT